LPTFFVVTYLVAWAFFFAGGMTPAAWPRGLLFLLGTFAPGYVALWLTSRESGRGGVTALLRRLVDWQVPARWYAFAAAYIVVIKLTVALVHRVTTGAWPQFGQLPWYLMLAVTVGSTVLGSQAGEEVGWRGYALPRLAARFGAARACCSACCGRAASTRPASHSRYTFCKSRRCRWRWPGCTPTREAAGLFPASDAQDPTALRTKEAHGGASFRPCMSLCANRVPDHAWEWALFAGGLGGESIGRAAART